MIAHTRSLELHHTFDVWVLFASFLSPGIVMLQELLDHNSLKTTQLYTHVSVRHISQTQSPLNKLDFD